MHNSVTKKIIEEIREDLEEMEDCGFTPTRYKLLLAFDIAVTQLQLAEGRLLYAKDDNDRQRRVDAYEKAKSNQERAWRNVPKEYHQRIKNP